MSPSNDLIPPQPDTRDFIYSIVTGLVSPIPYASELIKMIVKSPIEKRREKFVQSLALVVTDLLRTVPNLTLEKLSQDDRFVTTVIEVCKIADTLHQEEKRQLFCNIVRNSALPEAPDESRQLIFIRLLDELTTRHVGVLAVFNSEPVTDWPIDFSDPSWRLNISLSKLVDVIEEKYPDISGEFELCMKILLDLHSKGLISNVLPQKGLLATTYSSPVLTPFATQFLKYVSKS